MEGQGFLWEAWHAQGRRGQSPLPPTYLLLELGDAEGHGVPLAPDVDLVVLGGVEAGRSQVGAGRLTVASFLECDVAPILSKHYSSS